MKLRWIVLIIIVLVSFMACKQPNKAVWSATKNIVTAPLDVLKSGYNLVTGNTMNSYLDKSKREIKVAKKRGKVFADPRCYEKEETQVDKLGNEIIKLEKKLCQCKAWAQCPKNGCSCEVNCPDDLRIFKHASNKSNAIYTNSFAFRDSLNADAYKGNQATKGYCWGFSSMTSKFNRLAFFNPRKLVPCIEDETCKMGDKKYLEYMKGIIDDIAANKPREIPGFNNLKSFSNTKFHGTGVQLYLGKTIASEWAKHAMSMQGVAVVTSQMPVLGLGRSTQSKETRMTLVEDVKERLKYGIQPQIIFAEKGNGPKSHVALVSSVFEEKGQTIFCMRDGSNPPEYNRLTMDGKCYKENRVVFKKDGSAFYNDWRSTAVEVGKKEYFEAKKKGIQGQMELNAEDSSKSKYYIVKKNKKFISSLRLTHNDGPDTVQQIHNLRAKCLNERECRE